MDIASVVLNQLIIMACLIFVGYICSKTKLISLNGVGQLSNLLLNVVVPCVILKSFMIEFNTQKLITFAIACFFGFLAHFVMLLIASILYKKTNGDEYKVKRFALIFSNCGFMAIPIISAVLGNEGVFYSSAFLIANNTLTFSYGVFILNSQEKSTFKSSVIKILLNPAIISVLVGFVIFICQIPIPGFLSSTASFFEGMNTPLAMVIMGVYICHTNLKKAFGNKKKIK
ncbi:MAG: AEC family transporter [Oscillospiraceae bacterium]